MDPFSAAKRVLIALLALAACQGCAAERTLTITSDPTDAAVRFGDRVVGRTPLTIPFVHYGVRRVTVYKSGFQTRTQRVSVEPPWYAAFPVDILSEVLFPVGWKDKHYFHMTLAEGRPEGSPPDLRSVLDRAETLRRASPDGPESLPPVQVVSTRRVNPELAAEPIEAPSETPAVGGGDPQPPGPPEPQP